MGARDRDFDHQLRCILMGASSRRKNAILKRWKFSRTLRRNRRKNVFGHLAQARIKSAAGDFETAATEVKAATSGRGFRSNRKSALQQLLDRLTAKQDINK